MPWFTAWPESIKKRACRYLLQHYLGQFLQEKLHLDQLSVDLYNGTGHVNDVALDIWALNSMLDQAHAPIELVDGYIGSIVVSIPWSALLNDNCKVEIKGLEVTLQPKYRTDVDLGNMTDSFYRSLGNMTTSMQLAQECLKDQGNESQDTSTGGLFEGLEVFAQTIESVLSRVKVSFTDIVVRIEHLPENSKEGIGLEIHIDRIDYFDEVTMGDEDPEKSPNKRKESQHAKSDIKTVFQNDIITCKHFRASGIQVFLDEFPEQLRTSPPGSDDAYPSESPDNKTSTVPINISCSPEFVSLANQEVKPDVSPEDLKSEGPFLIGKFFGWQELKLRIRQSETPAVPKLDAECFLGSCSVFLTPHQVHLLTEFASGIVSPSSTKAPNQAGNLSSTSPYSMGAHHHVNIHSPTGISHHSNTTDAAGFPTRNEVEDARENEYQDIDDGDQFFSMEGSKLYSSEPASQSCKSSEYESSEYGTSIYSESTGFAPSSIFGGPNHSKLPDVRSMQPTSKLMGAGHQSPLTATSPTEIKSQTRSEEDKSTTNHCHYQVQIRAVAVTILHINPLPSSPAHTSKDKHQSGLAAPLYNPQASGCGSDVDNITKNDSCSAKSKYLSDMSDKYFTLCKSKLEEVLKSDISQVRNDLAEVCCPHDHLRFTAAHIHFTSNQKTTNISNTEVSLGRAEFTECVFSDSKPSKGNCQKDQTKSPYKTKSRLLPRKSPKHSEILVFEQKQNSAISEQTLPNIKIQLSTHDGQRSAKTSLYIHLSACQSEVDISIIDRLSTLLYPPEPQTKHSSTTASLFSPPSYYTHVYADAVSRQAVFNEALAEDSKDMQFNFNISASNLKINFRFPIADLRPEMERRPWYARSLRDEILVLEACDIAFITSSLGRSGSNGSLKWNEPGVGSCQQSQEFEITVKDLHVLYSDEPSKQPKSFLRISQNANEIEPLGGPMDGNNDLDCPHFKVTINPSHQENTNTLLRGNGSLAGRPATLVTEKSYDETDFPSFDDDDFPMTGSHESRDRSHPSPFSQRKVVYNSEEMIFPGDASELHSFTDHANSSALVSLSIHLPAVNVFLVSKSFFENLYNRINNDILLWAPAAPKPHGKSKSWFDARSTSHLGDSVLPMDLACHLMLESQADSNEDASSTNSDSDGETGTERCKSFMNHSRKGVKSVNEIAMTYGRQSLIAITTKIGYGRLSARCNTLQDDGTISDAEHGEIVIMLENANIFNVARYHGNPLLDYVCVQISTLKLYHKASIPSLHSFYSNVEKLTGDRPDHLDIVMGASEEGIARTFASSTNAGNGTESQNMLVLAIKIETEEARPMKQCLIAACISGATLYHKFAKAGASWLEQLIDFIDATDDQVLGYQPPSFITEIHLNVQNSAASYQPLYMSPAVGAVVTASSFSLSSNIVAGAPLSVLNIMIDEAKLYITDKCNKQDIELLQDYACVLDVNVFEIRLTLSNEGVNPAFEESGERIYPLIDLQASNNMIMLRTCADSCSLLAALIRYLADDGDFANLEDEDVDTVSTYRTDINDDMVGDWADGEPGAACNQALEDSQDKTEDSDLPDLMADAMEDTFEDAVADLDFLRNNTKSAMTESMYAFSTSNGSHSHVATNHRSIQNAMSQSVMIPNTGRVKGSKCTQSRFQTKNSKNLYYSAFAKDGLRHDSSTPDDDEFCIIDDLGTGILLQNGEPEIKYGDCGEGAEDDKHINIHENHFKRTLGKVDQLQAPEYFPTPVVRYTLKEMSCIWSMYGGSDFGSTEGRSRKNSGAKVKEGSNLHGANPPKSSPIQLKYNARKRRLSFCKQGSTRDPTMLMEWHLTKVRCQHEQYPEDTLEVARTVVLVSDFEVRDKLQSSRINKFLYRFHSEASPKQAHAKTLLVKALQIRPEGCGTPTECRLRISLQPLRLNVDQDTLTFLTKFFSDVSSTSDDDCSPSHWVNPMSAYETAVGTSSTGNSHASPKSQGTPYASPVMTRPNVPQTNAPSASPSSIGSSPLLPGTSPAARDSTSISGKTGNHHVTQPLFFRELVFSPEVPIRLDYHGKRIDTEQGTFAGLLMGLGQLNCSQLKLKRVDHRHGLLGVDKLISFLLSEWAADIRANQLPLILGGVGPMHSVVQLFKGVRDLVYLPVEQYRKDGRLVRGLQKGATSFGTSTAMATLEITNRAIGLIQSAAETTYELVSPPELHKRQSHAQRNWRTLGHHAVRRQPADIREGMSNAITVVRDGVQDTAGAIVRVAQKEHERKGVTGAVGGVLRHIPPALVRPVIMATEATTNVLSGIRNQIQPDAKQQDEDKWKNVETSGNSKNYGFS